jgi:CRISPR-associated endonuclease/helicase Cas3
MRVLVEQTVRNARGWVEAAREDFAHRDEPVPRVQLLMGGALDLDWVLDPAGPAILVGTQDMLLSRALMRGYGMSPFQWPIHFALLQNDALWIFDEVQLMGPGVPTGAQLQGLRDRLGTARLTRSMWVSATLNPAWLETYDFRSSLSQARRVALEDADWSQERVRRRLEARKSVRRATAVLDASTAKNQARAYQGALAQEIAGLHRPGTTILAVLNQVERAQGVYQHLRRVGLPAETDLLLLHSRYRPPERRLLEARLREAPPPGGRIVVSTQVVEAGVDMSSAALVTELCPWPSFVQRCGRCNRYGEHPSTEVVWAGLDLEVPEAVLPYEPDQLRRSREILGALTEADPGKLPSVREPIPPFLLLRDKDFLDLFNTDPDLSGFHVDVSPYIRDSAETTLQVFWRSLACDRPNEDTAEPAADELCPASIGAVSRALATRAGWAWDPLAGEWREIGPRELRPGMVVLLDAGAGGYGLDVGFHPSIGGPVEPIVQAATLGHEPYGGDRETASGTWVPLRDHIDHVVAAAEELLRDTGGAQLEREVLIRAARWHDVGKAHPVFRDDLVRNLAEEDEKRRGVWAKSQSAPPGARSADVRDPRRRFFRHELASALAWLAHRAGEPEADLVAFLIAAHHGRVRLGLRALPEEPRPDGDRLFARGVWAGDQLPALDLGGGEAISETTLSLDLMKLGEGPQGPSWIARTQGLLARLGPFRLAWLEALLRIADWRASATERGEVPGGA